MGRKVFLDVGGHTGETLSVVVDPRWEYDRIWSFEPASVCWPPLDTLADERVEVIRSGLWSKNTEMVLHDPGSRAGSIEHREWHTDSETCSFINGSDWMRQHISHDDDVWMKVNIEGAETELLQSLVESGEIRKVGHLLVHFDALKTGHDDAVDSTRRALGGAGVTFVEAHEVMFGRSVEAKTETWLMTAHGQRVRPLYRKFVHRLRGAIWHGRKRLAAR